MKIMAGGEAADASMKNTAIAPAGRPKRPRAAPAQQAVPDAMQPPAHKKTILVSLQEEPGKTGSDSAQAEESAYHQIYYGRQRISERTPPPDRLQPVDLPRALEDTLSLGIADPAYKSQEYAVVVFYNQQTLESIQIIRNNTDVWDLSMPVYESDSNVCHTHMCQADTAQVKLIVTRFFEGGDWRGVKKFEFDPELLEINLDLERRRIKS